MPDKLECYIHYSEHDFNHKHPTLVIRGECGTIGYDLDPETGAIEGRSCLCSAWSANECACGAWYEFEGEQHE